MKFKFCNVIVVFGVTACLVLNLANGQKAAAKEEEGKPMPVQLFRHKLTLKVPAKMGKLVKVEI